MPDSLGVTPDGLRGTSGHLEDASSKVHHVLSSLIARVEGEGAPWGDDKTGDGFANGPDGYLAQYEWVKSSVGAKTGLLDDYAESMRTAANTLEHLDNG